MPGLSLVFMGTPGFALPALRALIATGHRILCVYSQPPRPAGRGYAETRSPVHAFADTEGIPVRTPRTLRDPAAQAEFAAFGADAAVVAAYGLILPPPVLAAPRLGCINVHASLLPRWRGAAPIQHAILAGDLETGITIMQMDRGLDTGPILLQESVPIGPRTTASELHDVLAELGGRLVAGALDALDRGALTPRPQPEGGATYAPKLDRAQGRLDWRRPAAVLDRQVRALDPWPGAWFEHAGQQIKLIRAEPIEGKGGAEPGTVLDDRFAVACGEGALRLLDVQRPGRAPTGAAAFLRGYDLPPGTRLGQSG